MLLALAILWGGSFFFFKVMVAELPPFTVVLGRVGLAALILNVWLALRRDYMPTSPGCGGPSSPWACSTTSSRSR